MKNWIAFKDIVGCRRDSHLGCRICDREKIDKLESFVANILQDFEKKIADLNHLCGELQINQNDFRREIQEKCSKLEDLYQNKFEDIDFKISQLNNKIEINVDFLTSNYTKNSSFKRTSEDILDSIEKIKEQIKEIKSNVPTQNKEPVIENKCRCFCHRHINVFTDQSLTYCPECVEFHANAIAKKTTYEAKE